MILRTAARFGGRSSGPSTSSWVRRRASPGPRWPRSCDFDGGLDAVEWTPLERAALRAVDETAADGAVADATWEELAAQLRESELVELLMLIAHYEMLTSVLRSLRIELEPRAEALARRVPGGPAA